MSDFTGVFGNNQGILQTLQRDNTNSALPILLRNNPTLPAAPAVSYPIATNSLTNILNAFDSNLQLPFPPDEPARRQHRQDHPAGLARALVTEGIGDWGLGIG
jgi:hypothetical protein